VHSTLSPDNESLMYAYHRHTMPVFLVRRETVVSETDLCFFKIIIPTRNFSDTARNFAR